MSSALPSGHPGQPPGPAAAADDPALAAAVRIQRRRHRWGVSVFWFLGALALCAGINSSANSGGTPSPSWFIDLTIAFGVAAAVALGVAIGYSVAMRAPARPRRAQAFALERQRAAAVAVRLDGAALPGLLLVGRYGWGMALFLGCAGIGVPLAINGAAYLAGAGHAVRWSAAMPIHGDADAAGSLVIGLLFVFGGVMVVFYVYRRATRVWWPRLQGARCHRRAGVLSA